MDKEIVEIKPCEVNVGDKSVTFEIRGNLTMYYGKAHIAIFYFIYLKRSKGQKLQKTARFWLLVRRLPVLFVSHPRGSLILRRGEPARSVPLGTTRRSLHNTLQTPSHR